MTQYSLIGHFGDQDKPTLPQENNYLAFNFEKFPFGVAESLKQLYENGIVPSEVALDLLFLAILVQAADSRLNRESASQDAWSRKIRIVLPVSNVKTWENARELLTNMLNFLSGDFWSFEFRDRPSNFQKLIKNNDAQLGSDYNKIALFSGGLDSLIGAIDLLESNEIPFFVSHAGESGVSKPQQILFDNLKSKYEQLDAVVRLRYPPPRFAHHCFKDMKKENTSRSRSFLFFSLGIFAGSGLNKEFELIVPENGLIALNVPLDPTRIGALSTRTTHPYYMHRWNDLVKILGIPCKTVYNPYWNKTKGEMVKNCKNQNVLSNLLEESLSCAHPSVKRYAKNKPGYNHCGTCVPCIIRMAAIKYAWNNDPTTYSTDISDATLTLASNKAIGTQVRAYQYAINTLKNNYEIAKIRIHMSGPLSDEFERVDELARVYLRGMSEVSNLLSCVNTEPYFKPKINEK